MVEEGKCFFFSVLVRLAWGYSMFVSGRNLYPESFIFLDVVRTSITILALA